MDLAGLDTDDAKTKRAKGHQPSSSGFRLTRRNLTTPFPIILRSAPKPRKQPTDDDFFKVIEDDVKKPD